jgi:hypothetical protein
MLPSAMSRFQPERWLVVYRANIALCGMIYPSFSDATGMSRQIPVYRPDLSGNELCYVIECVDSSWISSIGSFIERFERSVAETVGARHAIAVCNGTVALHLAMHCLRIGPVMRS